MATALDLIRRAQGQQAQDAATSDQELQTFLDAAADMGEDRVERYELYESFYEGEHRTELTDRAREFLERKGVRFAENFCEPAVDMKAERLVVTGFDVRPAEADGGDPTEASPQAMALGRWLTETFWQGCRMDGVQDTMHTASLTKGDAFGIVGWDNAAGAPTFSFNAPEMVKAVYDDESPDRMMYAVKRWASSRVGPSNPEGRAIIRLNLYYPDRIEKFYRMHRSDGRGGWARWMDEPTEGESAAWPTPWVDAQGHPLGIPVIHFRNNAKGRCYGRSELAGVIPQNMLLNKQVLDLVAIEDSQAWPQMWGTGIDAATADYKKAPGTVWTAPGDAKFGQLDAAQLEPVVASIESTLSRIARRARLPLHLITGGDAPSGESLKAAESGLVSIVKNRQVTLGNSWEDAAMMALRLASMAKVLPPEAGDISAVTITAQWQNPVTRDEKGEAETAILKKSLGVSKHTLLRELGYDPDEEEARRKTEAEEAQVAQARFFDGGGDTTEPGSGTPSPADGGSEQ